MESSRDPISSIPNVTITVCGIQHLLSTLNTNKACGPDHISPYILKHCTEELNVTSFTIFFSQSLDFGVLPTDWLVADVYPIHKKKGSHTEPSNYRPILLISVCCKVNKWSTSYRISYHHRTSQLKQFAYK